MVRSEDNPLVSVIMPAYNAAQFLVDAIDSALAQTWTNLEVIVVDDGSTDGTLRVLRERAEGEPRLRVVTQANGGVARARNRAIEAARGSLIAPLDADDVWEPTKIERQVRRMLAAGSAAAMVYTNWVWIDAAGVVVDRSPRWDIEGSVFHALLEINFTGNASVPLFRRHALEEVGGYSAALAEAGAGGCEDWEVALRIARRYRVLCVPEALVGYRRRVRSMSTGLSAMWRSRELMIDELRQEKPAIPEPVLRRSERQYCLYLAGVAFWAGKLPEAFLWGIRSGVRLPLAVMPYVVRMLMERVSSHLGVQGGGRVQRMRPGVPLESGLLPKPYIDYARVYRKLTLSQPIGYERSGDDLQEIG